MARDGAAGAAHHDVVLDLDAAGGERADGAGERASGASGAGERAGGAGEPRGAGLEPKRRATREREPGAALEPALGTVLARLDGSPSARGIACVLWHGAGSDFDEPVLTGLAARLTAAGIAVARPRFPYRQRAALRGRAVPPDRLPVLLRAASATLHALAPHLGAPHGTRWVIGGRSLGARVACHLAARGGPAPWPLAGVLSLAYPLAPPRAARPRPLPFAELGAPLLAFQGGRDPFGGPDALRAALADAQAPWLAQATGLAQATVVALGAADHALAEPKRGGRALAAVLDEVAERTLAWLNRNDERGGREGGRARPS